MIPLEKLTEMASRKEVAILMLKIFYRIFFISFFLQFIISCASNHEFNIQLYDGVYNDVNVLMNEIYQNALDDNVDYFKYFVEKEYERILSRREEPVNTEWESQFDFDRIHTTAARDLMRMVIGSKLHKTYKKRARMSWEYNGFLLDYLRYDPKMRISYVMLIKFIEEGDDGIIVALDRFISFR